MSVGDNLLWWYPEHIICFVLSAFIYVNLIITRGHFPTFYHEITFCANKQEENIITRAEHTLSFTVVGQGIEKNIFGGCLLACFFRLVCNDNLKSVYHHLKLISPSRHIHFHIYTHIYKYIPQRVPKSSKIFFKNNLWSKKIFCVPWVERFLW